MNELALFAGAGGGILGGKLVGWRTVCAVERDGYARNVLLARQNDGILEPFPIWDDVTTFDGKPWRGIVDVVSGGFPCQDISPAGKRHGITGERSGLWKHMARIIGEVSSPLVFIENSAALPIRGLHVVLYDLAQMGYDAKWGIIGADTVGLPHKRNRCWIVAHTIRNEFPREKSCGRPAGRVGRECKSLERDGDWKAALSKFRGMDDGLAPRVERTDAIRNGQVPAVAALAWKILSLKPQAD